jgi:HPt (histidine-containing phosphotransfer) domain-containing protein
MALADEPIELPALRRLLNVIGGDRADLSELIDDFVSSTPELVAQMSAAAAAADSEALTRAAHTLKSNAKDFGAARLAALCAALERESREGPVPDVAASIAAIAEEEEMARKALGALNIEDLDA